MSLDLTKLSDGKLAERLWTLNDQYLFGPVKLDPIAHFGPLRDEWRRRDLQRVDGPLVSLPRANRLVEQHVMSRRHTDRPRMVEERVIGGNVYEQLPIPRQFQASCNWSRISDVAQSHWTVRRSGPS